MQPAENLPEGDETENSRPLFPIQGGGQGGPPSSRDNIKPVPDPVYDKRGNVPDPQTKPARHLNAVPNGQDLNNMEKEPGSQAAGASDVTQAERSFFKPENSAPRRWQLRKILASRRRKVMVGAGLAIAGVSIFGIFAFLGVFKLDFLMNNIDTHTFARFNASLDTRNSRYVLTYMTLRLADIGDVKNIDTDNLIFRSNKVRTGNPIHDWYQSMRTSSFEKDVFDKYGIKFTSIAYREGNQIKFRAAQITYNGQTFHGQSIPDNVQTEIRTAINSGSPADWLKVNSEDWVGKYLDIKEFDTNKDARVAIKKVVTENTYFFQVIKRRHIRKAIANETGVKSWRFFDKTRTKLSEDRIAMRNKIIAAMVPESTKSGKFINCLFGISDCKFSEDPVNPANEADNALVGSDKVKPDASGQYRATDANGNPVTKVIDYGPGVDVIKNILSKTATVFNALNWVSMLDSLSRVSHSLSNHSLSKGVTVARTAQAIGLYQVLETARDQIKSGQVDSGEVNTFMQTLGPITNNEGYSAVIKGQPAPTQTTAGLNLFRHTLAATSNNSLDRTTYCKSEHQKQLQDNPAQANSEFTYLCPNKQIGASSNAKALENGWNSTVGTVLNPILAIYEGVRGQPIIGSVLNIFNDVVGQVSNAVVKGVINGLGLGGDVKAMGQYLSTQVMGFLGAGPIINCPDVAHCGQDAAGVYVNTGIQGAAATSEASIRDSGGAATTAASRSTAQSNLSTYDSELNSSRSVYQKFLALSNPDSAGAKTVFALSNTSFASLSSKLSPKSVFGAIFSGFGSLFSPKASAATADDGYTAANFAGIQTYDYPKQCFDLDPLSAQPLDGTNVMQVFAQNNLVVDPDSQAAFASWDTETNSTTFYQTIYKVLAANNVEDTDSIAQQIYNCNLLDNTVRGGLGAAYGYNGDNRLQ